MTLLALLGCPGDKAPAPAPRADSAIHIVTVDDNRGLLFSFFDRRATLRTVETIAKVAPHARAEVQVTDPRRRLPGDAVYVSDLRKKNESGKYRVWIEERGAWLGRNMPKVSELKKPIAVASATRPKVKRKRHRPRRRPRRVASKSPKQKPGSESGSPIVQPAGQARAAKAAKVVLFSTSWCPSCRTAKAFFQSRGIPFVELDVEKDRKAAEQYVAVCRKVGLKQGAVPVIIVNGQVFQGFSAAQITRALASS